MDIVPVDIVTTDIVTKISVNVVRVEIFKSATIYVCVTTDTGKQIKRECLELSGDDYTGWSNDDTYLYTYAANKLGYTLEPNSGIIANTIVPGSVVTDPVATDPVVTDPVATDPVATDPVVTDPDVTDPVVTAI